MKKRCLSLLVENNTGVLAKVSGLFSGKNYNLDSLSVGATEDESISRITLTLLSDERTFEQIKKQLNRCIEIIKVLDLTGKDICHKEAVFIKIRSNGQLEVLFRLASAYHANIVDFTKDEMIIESFQTEEKNAEMIQALQQLFQHIEIVRGGSIAIEALLKQ